MQYRLPFILNRGFHCLAFLLAFSVCAQLPQPKLWTVFPAGGQVRSTVELTVTGADLEGEGGLMFSDPGIQARPKLDDKEQAIKNQFLVDISESVDAGRYEVWASGKYGVSNSRLFIVGDLEETVDDKPVHDVAGAIPLRLGTTVHGRSVANQRNYYRIFARQGQRVLVICMGESIDSRIEPVLELLDGRGRKIRKDRKGQVLDYTAETTGPLFVSVSDLTYRGGDQYFYRLTIHADSHADYVLPLSVTTGAEQRFHVLGRNLGESQRVPTDAGGGLDYVMMKGSLSEKSEAVGSMGGVVHSVPGAFGRDGVFFTALRTRDGSGKRRLGLSKLPSIVEASLIQDESAAQDIKLPVSVSGMFYPRGDTDRFEFNVEKGAEYWVDVQSSRLGYGTSPMVVVERLEEGENGEWVARKVSELIKPTRDIGDRAFPMRSRDPSGLVKFKEGGRYRLTITDLFNLTKSSPGRLYELQVRPASPGFRAYSIVQSSLHRNIARKAPVEGASLLPGQVLPMRIRLDRIDGFKGDVEIVATEQPEGITVHPLKIMDGANDGILLVEAARDAKPTAGDLVLTGTATLEGRTVVHEVEHGQVVWEVGDYNNDPVLSRVSPNRKLSIAAAEAFPISIADDRKEAGPWATSVAGLLKIPVKAERRGEFGDALTFKVGGLKALSKHPGVKVEKGKNDGVLELDLTKTPLKPGIHELYLYAEVKGKYRRESGGDLKDLTTSSYSPPLKIEVFPAPFEIVVENDKESLEVGAEKSLSVLVKRRFGFEGQIEVATSFAKEVAGVTTESSMLRNDRFDLTIRSDASAAAAEVMLELKASGQLNGKTVTAQQGLRVALQKAAR